MQASLRKSGVELIEGLIWGTPWTKINYFQCDQKVALYEGYSSRSSCFVPEGSFYNSDFLKKIKIYCLR